MKDLKLRAVEPEDAELFYEADNDPCAWADSDTVAPYSRHMLRRYAENYDADPLSAGQLRLIAVHSDGVSEEAVGIIDLYEISLLHGHAWVGIYVLPSKRGNGYGSGMLRLIADYAHTNLRLSNLGARILSCNVASLDLFRRCGYILRGTLPSWRFVADHPVDLHLLTLKLS